MIKHNQLVPLLLVVLLLVLLRPCPAAALYNEWAAVVPVQATPIARAAAQLASAQGCSPMLFGGIKTGNISGNIVPLVMQQDAWIFSQSATSWMPIGGSGIDPLAARRTMAACTMDFQCRALCFGGGSVPAPPQDTDVYIGQGFANLSRLRTTDDFVRGWVDGSTQILERLPQPQSKTSQTWPAPRMQATFTLVGGAALVLLGGRTFDGSQADTSTPMLDPWLYDLQSERWLPIAAAAANSHQPPAPRYGHITATIRARQYTLLMMGGCDVSGLDPCDTNSSLTLSDAWMLSLNLPVAVGADHVTGSWTLLTLDPGVIVPQYAPAGTPSGACVQWHSGSSNDAATTSLYCIALQQQQVANVLDRYSISMAANKTTPTVQYDKVPIDLLSPAPPSTVAYVVGTTSLGIVLYGGFQGIGFTDMTWLLSPKALFWRNDVTNNVAPADVLLGVVGVIDRKIFTLGGISANGVVEQSAWVMDFDTQQWVKLHASTDVAATFGAALTPIRNDTFMLLGGQDHGWNTVLPPRISDVWLYAPLDFDAPWRPVVTAIRPTPRFGHTAVALTTLNGTLTVLVFGGWRTLRAIDFLTGELLGDLWIFSLPAGGDAAIDGSWQQLTRTADDSSNWPRARGFHTAATIHNAALGRSVMVVTGGYSQGQENEVNVDTSVWLFDVEQLRWTQAMVDSAMPVVPFLSASITPDPTHLLIHGGVSWINGSLTAISDVYVGSFADGRATQWQWAPQAFEPLMSRAGASMASDGRNPPVVIEVGGVHMMNGALTAGLPMLLTQLACPAGTRSLHGLGIGSCEVCAVGTFSTDVGSSSCRACPGNTYTASPGSTSVANCTLCVPNYCNGHGECSVSATSHNAQCSCDIGYSGPSCKLNMLALVAGNLLAGLFIFSVIVYLVYRYRRRYRQLHSYSQLQDKLIAESQQELDVLRRVWDIEAGDVDLQRRIDGGSEGAFGEVWVASWLGRTVAIKRLRLAVQELDPSAVQDFNTEVEALKTMRHRNIVFFYGAGVMDGSPFLVTEFMERGSLRQVLKASGASLPWLRRISFAADIAAGMRFLHGLKPPRLHRDLKCANVLVTAAWVCKIGDFGTARILCGSRQVKRRQMEETVVDIREEGQAEDEGMEYAGAHGGGRSGRRRVHFALPKKLTIRRSVRRGNPGDDIESDDDEQSGGGSRSKLVSSAAKTASDVGSYTGADFTLTTTVGTFLWTAPEVLRDLPYGLAADVYSFGIVLAELADPERLPFSELQGNLWTLRRLISEEGRRPQLPDTTPADFCELAEACWQAVPPKRPTFDAVCLRLQAMQAGLGGTVSPVAQAEDAV